MILIDYKKLYEDKNSLEETIKILTDRKKLNNLIVINKELEKQEENIEFMKRVLNYMKFLIKNQEQQHTTSSVEDDLKYRYKCKDCFYYNYQEHDKWIPTTTCNLYGKCLNSNEGICFGFLPKEIVRR